MSSLQILEAAFTKTMSMPENWDKRPDLRCSVGDVFTGLNDWEESTTWAWVEYAVYGNKKRCWIHFHDAPKEQEGEKVKIITAWLRALEAAHSRAKKSYDLTDADSAYSAYQTVADKVAGTGIDRIAWVPVSVKKTVTSATPPDVEKLGVSGLLPPK